MKNIKKIGAGFEKKDSRLGDDCARIIENWILSGQVRPGDRLPPERELAARLNVSRPVVRDALSRMAAVGLVRIIPRVGSVVNDYRRHGSLNLLTSLVNYTNGDLAPELLRGLLDMRRLFENENARLAAANRRDSHVERLYRIVIQEADADPGDCEILSGLDFEFHLTLAEATGNPIYPMLLNSFKPVYTRFTRLFFSEPETAGPVCRFHKDLCAAVAAKDEGRAAAVMDALLDHGERELFRIISRNGGVLWQEPERQEASR